MSDFMSYVTHELGYNGLKLEKNYQYNYDNITKYSKTKDFEKQCTNSGEVYKEIKNYEFNLKK